MALKWGFASAGKISHDFANAIGTLNEADHQLVAVTDPFCSSTEFAERFGIPNAYSSYLELAKDPNVEVVHIGVLNPKHLEVALLMLEHGKHVLVEKPLCMNEKQAQKLIRYAEQRKLFLMEAIWSRFLPSNLYVRQQIDSGVLGEITSVEVEFGFEDLYKLERISRKDLGGGSLLDLGVYTIIYCQFVFQEEPKSVTATGKLSEEGIDLEMSGVINYGNNRVGKIKSSIVRTLSNTAKIIGTKGQITIPSFWSSFSLIDVDGTEKNWPLPDAKHPFNYTNSCGLRFEAEEVRKCIRTGKLESDAVTHNESLLFLRIADEIRKQIGVKFPQDD